MSSEESNTNNNQDNKEQKEKETYYQRKKNFISGIDNDQLNLAIGGLGVALGLIALAPYAKGIIDNVMKPKQQQLPPPPPPPQLEEQQYIPPTPPANQQQQVMNGHNAPPLANANLPVDEQRNTVQNQQEEEDGLFHEQELRKRQKMLGRKPTGARYDSPFGKDIGGL